MLTVTRRGAWLAPVAIVAATWAAGALGNLATGEPLTSSTTPDPAVVVTSAPDVVVAGEAQRRPVRATPSPRANRSRPSAKPAAAPFRGERLSVTAYCWTGNKTASGVWPQIGMAAGPWPFGTRLRVEGVGVVTVQDRYGWGTSLDIYLGREGCERRARQFGRQHLLVEVVSRG